MLMKLTPVRVKASSKMLVKLTTVFSERSVGILVDGVPMVCGVDRDILGTYQSCYKFNPTTKGWTPVTFLLDHRHKRSLA